jgi:hypothetical protein
MRCFPVVDLTNPKASRFKKTILEISNQVSGEINHSKDIAEMS